MIQVPNVTSLIPQENGSAPPDMAPVNPGVQSNAVNAAQGSPDALAAPQSPAPVAPLAATTARNAMVANQLNPGNWSQNVVAGVMSALSGFGVEGQAPVGAGVLSGVGKAVEMAQKRKLLQRQQQIEQHKVEREDLQQDREYDLRVAENARQQSKDVRDMAEHDQRMHAFTQDASIRNLQLAKAESDFRQGQIDREDALKAVGAKPLTVAGEPSPAFKDLGEAEKYAVDNKLFDGSQNGYRSRIVYGADGQYHLFEVPDSGVKEYTLKDPDGKEVKITTDPLGALNYQEKVQELRKTKADINEKNAKAAKERADAGGNSLTDKAIVAADAFTKMQADPDYARLPADPETGRVDQDSPAYKALDAKYGVTDAYNKAKLGYNTSTGEPYLRALTASNPTMAGTVVALGEGREDFASALPRGKEKKQYIDALNRAYPGFDEGEQKTYFKARQQYSVAAGGTSPGYAINAGQTAFTHLADLQRMNTNESRIPGTKAYQDYQTQMHIVSDELAKFYGTTTIPGIDAFNASLAAPLNRGAAITTMAAAMDTKMNEYQTQWNSAIPKYLKQAGKTPPMPGISPQAMADRTKLLAPPDTHVWSAKAFQAANPKATPADVTAAGAQMKAQGYTIGP